MGYFRAGHGFEFICFLLETRWGIPLFCFLNGVVISWLFGSCWLAFFLGAILSPVCILLSSTAVLFFSSQSSQGGGKADWTPWLDVKDASLKEQYAGKKMPIDVMYESYMHGKIDMKQDVYKMLLNRNELFCFTFTLKYSVRWFLGTFLGQNVNHSVSHDNSEVAHVYDRGNDFYNWFLGETMIYTSGIFESQQDSLEEAQYRKLTMVCNNVHMKEGDEHLDIGCGWGTLLRFASSEFQTNSTGITLAKEQVKWHEEAMKKHNADESKKKIKSAKSMVLDYRKLPDKQYDCITCLEMAEHVGIKNFQNFLLQVKGLLKDEGLFYLQIAGLRRTWQYEDLMWGIFMGQYIFPAADASCPIGWVATQLERAGFEVHRVENCGVHYSLTIKNWYDNWMKNEDKIVAKYGQYWFRMWAIFLAWSAIIAAQGSSTVFMITCHKNHKNDGSSIQQKKGDKKLFSRMDTFVGKNTLAVQQ